jgi:uncharacterized protein
VSLSKIFGWLSLRREEASPPPPPRVPKLTDINFGYGDEALDEAGAMAEIRRLLKSGAKPDDVSSNGGTVLHTACQRGWLDAAKMLLDAGANPNLGDSRKITPFMFAAGGGNPDLMQLLLDRGADAKALDANGHNAFYHYIMDPPSYRSITDPALQERDRRAMKMLQDLGIELEPVMDHFIYKHRRHLAPLLPYVEEAISFEQAVKDKNYPKVQQMLNAGMHPDRGAQFSSASALTLAAANNDLEMMGRLMARGADVNNHGEDGPLHAAARAGAREAFAKLVGAGADTDVLYAYDRYPDTNIAEAAGYCKKDPGMRAFVEDSLARKPEVIADYEATKSKFLYPDGDAGDDVTVHHAVKQLKPLRVRHAG